MPPLPALQQLLQQTLLHQHHLACWEHCCSHACWLPEQLARLLGLLLQPQGSAAALPADWG
jgi:hypothetical protein